MSNEAKRLTLSVPTTEGSAPTLSNVTVPRPSGRSAESPGFSVIDATPVSPPVSGIRVPVGEPKRIRLACTPEPLGQPTSRCSVASH